VRERERNRESEREREREREKTREREKERGRKNRGPLETDRGLSFQNQNAVASTLCQRAAVEKTWPIQDSQGQILALAFK
jgi:hypothetical protein